MIQRILLNKYTWKLQTQIRFFLEEKKSLSQSHGELESKVACLPSPRGSGEGTEADR